MSDLINKMNNHLNIKYYVVLSGQRFKLFWEQLERYDKQAKALRREDRLNGL